MEEDYKVNLEYTNNDIDVATVNYVNNIIQLYNSAPHYTDPQFGIDATWALRNILNFTEDELLLRNKVLFAKKQKEMLNKMKKDNRRKYLKQVKSYLKSTKV